MGRGIDGAGVNIITTTYQLRPLVGKLIITAEDGRSPRRSGTAPRRAPLISVLPRGGSGAYHTRHTARQRSRRRCRRARVGGPLTCHLATEIAVSKRLSGVRTQLHSGD